MPRATYNVQDGMDVEVGKQAQRDSSYRACLHAMLIFIAICIILLVAAWPWNNHRAAGGKSSNITDPSSAAVQGEEDYATTRSSTKASVHSSTTPKPTTRHAKASTTTTRSTTRSIERKNPNTVIAVEETDAPATVVTTTQRTTTPSSHVEEPLETEKRLDVAHTTQSDDTSTLVAEDNNDILVVVSGADSTTQSDDTSTRVAEDNNDILVVVSGADSTTQSVATTTMPGEDASVVSDLSSAPTTVTPDREATDAIVTLIQEVAPTTVTPDREATDATVTLIEEVAPTTVTPDREATDPTVTLIEEVAPTTVTPDRTDEAGAPTSTTVVSNSDVDVFNSSTEEDESTRERYESSTVSSLPGSGLVCQSGHCKTIATRMLSLMNHSVDPCDDFYEHACGGLRSNPNLLGDDPSKDVYDRIKRGLNNIDDSSWQAHKTYKRYYDRCVHYDAEVTQEQRVAEARKIIHEVGTFNDKANPEPALLSLTYLITKLMQYHSTPLFDLMLDVDGHDPKQFRLKLTAPVFKPMLRPFTRREDCLKGSDTLDDLNSFYHGYITCKEEEHKVYLDELEDAIRILNIPISTNTTKDIRFDVELKLLSLIKLLPSAAAMQQALTGKNYVEMKIRDLIEDYPKVEWLTLTNALLGRDLPHDTPVQVYFKDYFDNMFREFTDLNEREQQNALLAWLAHDVYVDLVLTRDQCSREAYCLRVASDLMEEVAASLYLSTFEPDTLQAMRAEAQQVFDQLQRTLHNQLQDAKWLDGSSRSAAVNKLLNLKLTVDGGISVYLKKTFVNGRMNEITQKDANYITLSASLLKRYRRQMYSLYDANPIEPHAMWSHFLLPHSTQGIVVYALETVVIPYGLMTHPMYEPGLPRYLLMARLGFVIAHEMAHHFDVTGMSYGTNGRGDPLLSHSSTSTFRDRTNCLKDATSYSGTKVADDGRSITYKANESLSLNERIADRAGAGLGYETYLAWVREHGEPSQLPYLRLTNNEIYFLAIAQIFCSKTSILDYGVSLFEDEHLPPFLRVNTIMDNSNEFSSVFQCKVGVDMNRNPDDKCEAFPNLTAVDGTDVTPEER